MSDLSKLTNEQLVDILSTQTSLLIQMHTQGANKTEFQKCKLLIEASDRNQTSKRNVKKS